MWTRVYLQSFVLGLWVIVQCCITPQHAPSPRLHASPSSSPGSSWLGSIMLSHKVGGRVASLAPGALKMKGGADHIYFGLRSYILPLRFMGWSYIRARSGESCGFGPSVIWASLPIMLSLNSFKMLRDTEAEVRAPDSHGKMWPETRSTEKCLEMF